MKNIVIALSFLLVSVSLCGDINKAADWLSNHVNPKTTYKCASYVASALENGGFVFTRQNSAYMYHTNNVLKNLGFTVIPRPSLPLKGDMYVQLATNSHPDGHIALHDGKNWLSDFRQQTDNVYVSDAGEKFYYRYK